MFQYLTVISPGPFIIVRVPMAGRPGHRKLLVRWRALLTALTPVMQSHGLRKKDISAIENLCHPDDVDPDLDDPYLRPNEVASELLAGARATLEKVQAAFNNSTNFPKFWLYDWNDTDESFELVRRPIA